jgi:hypothetical protein
VHKEDDVKDHDVKDHDVKDHDVKDHDVKDHDVKDHDVKDHVDKDDDHDNENNKISAANSLRSNSLIEKNKEEDFLINFAPLSRQSQLSKILDEGTVKVAIQDDKAYWVIDNILYKCNIGKDGKINNENAERVDVFDMSEKEVSNLMSIIDSINS